MTSFDESRLLLLEKTGLPNPFPTWWYPNVISAGAAEFLKDDDEVLVTECDCAFRAYPLRLIAAHHIVQDRIESRHVVVTF